MPVTMGGMASGIDTDSIIAKLVEVEARPIRQWVDERNRSDQRKEALGVLRSHLKELNGAVKDLYGFRASFHDKKVISSNKDLIESSASKKAETGVKNVEVLELASTHKISTDPISREKKLPSGKIKIEVNGESETLKFRGGTLESLKDKISEAAKDIVSSAYIKIDNKNYVLTLESKTPGKKGAIIISGDKDFLKSIGLINGEKGAGKDTINIIFNEKYFTSYLGDRQVDKQDGIFRIEQKGKALSLSGVLWREYVLPVESPVKENTTLDFDLDYMGPDSVETGVSVSEIEIGPEERTVIKGIELKGYNISRTRTPETREVKKEVLDVLGVGAVSIKKGKRFEKIYMLQKGAKGKQSIPIGRDFNGQNLSKIIFYCNEGRVVFSNALLLTPRKGTGELAVKNEISGAKDARLKVDGVEVVRDRNTDINDVIKGVTLNLRGVTKGPVTLTVEPDIEKGIEKLKKFVKAYNDYLDINKELTRAEKTSKLDDYKNIKNKSGLFVGDMTILRLENYLKTAVSDAYSSTADSPVKIITEIGISTGSLNADWENIREGKLILDEGKCKDSIIENPDGVKEFFGTDTDGDNRVDNGMAYRMETILKPYLMSGNNIIVSKQKLEDNTISDIDEKIERHKDHLKKYEDKLRAKFAAMEKAVSGANAQRAWMQNQMKGLQGSQGGKKGK